VFCFKCEKKKFCKEVCKEVERYLSSQGIYKKDYIRKRREIPFSAMIVTNDKNKYL